MRKLLPVLCVVGLAFVVVGCGTSGGSDSSSATTTTVAKTSTTAASGNSGSGSDSTTAGSASDYTNAFITNLSTGSTADGQLVVTPAQATCVAPRWVKVMTVSKLRASGKTPKDVADPAFDGASLKLTPAQGTALTAAFAPCHVDIAELFARAITTGLTAEQQQCAVENIDGDKAKSMVSKTFSNGNTDAELAAIKADLIKDCNLPSS